MKYLIKIQNSTFSISHLLANALIDTKYSCSPAVQNKTKIFILNDSHIPLFQVVPTTSLTHFYVAFFGKKYRVSNVLYLFLFSPLLVNEVVLTNILDIGTFDKIIVSPLTWVGSKSKISQSIVATIPNSITNYHEPFLGSAVVLFHVLREQIKGNLQIKNGVYASDFNEDLINFFKTIQLTPATFYSTFVKNFVLPYNSLKNSADKSSFFYLVRSDFNSNLGSLSTIQSARFLFLNKTCYGGLFRTNSAGRFNVPFGYRKNLKFLGESSLLNISGLIRKVHFSHKIFNPQTISYEEGDFFYFDPPYVKMTETSFVNYLAGGFSDTGFFELLDFCKKLDGCGCFFTLSNSTSPKVLNFAKNYKILQYSTNSLKGYTMDQLLITNSHSPLNW